MTSWGQNNKNPVQPENNPLGSADDFNIRLATVLRGHVYPHGPHCKEVAALAEVDVQTVWSWLAGNGIRGLHLARLIARMPQTFAHYLFAGTDVIVGRTGDLERKRAELRAAEHHADRVARAINYRS